MNDERFLKDWLQDKAPDDADAQAEADRIVSRIPEVRQRRRWWPLDVRPAPERQQSSGDGSAADRRTTPMFSTVKAMAAIALAVVAGATMLALLQQQPSGDPAPATADDPVVAVPLRVDLHYTEELFGDRDTLPSGSTRAHRTASVDHILESSDPRFEGTATISETVDTHDGVELSIRVLRVENEDGAWQGIPSYEVDPVSSRYRFGQTADHVLVGEGGYEGHIAIVRATYRPEADDSSGVIIEPPKAPNMRLEGFILNTTDLPELPSP